MKQRQLPALQPHLSSFQLASPMHSCMDAAGNADQQLSHISHATRHFPEAPHSLYGVHAAPPPAPIDQMMEIISSNLSVPIADYSHPHPQSPPLSSTMAANLIYTSPITQVPELFHSTSIEIHCNNSADAVPDDDGSVASRLLSSVTKSIPSASLQLANCKEVARETPYQKSLSLKHMELQHCAEALGMESCNSPSSLSACHDIITHGAEPNEHRAIENSSSYPLAFVATTVSREGPSDPPVKFSPNSAASSFKLRSHYPKYNRCKSFPPPLSHTLPASSSSESLSFSLYPSRVDGRLILKEVMAPSKHYFHASRRDGRLTLHVLTRDKEEEHADDRVSCNNRNKPESCNDSHEVKDAYDSEEITPQGSTMRSEVSPTSFQGVKSAVVVTAVSTLHSLNEHATVTNASVRSVESLKEDKSNELPITSADVVTLKSLCVAAPSGAKSCMDSNGHVAEAIDWQCCMMQPSNNCSKDPKNGDSVTRIVSKLLALDRQAVSRRDPRSKHSLRETDVVNLRSIYPCCLSNGTVDACTLNSAGHVFPFNYHDIPTFVESDENFIWNSNLMPCAEGRQNVKARHKVGKFITHSVLLQVLEDYAHGLMKMVAGVKNSHAWALGRKRFCEHSTAIANGDLNETCVKTAWDGTNVGQGINRNEYIERIDDSGGICRVQPGHSVGLLSEQANDSGVSVGPTRDASLPSLSYSTCALALPTAPYHHVQDEELPNSNPNFKEPSVYHTSQFSVCSFIKPASCIATRS